MPPQSNITPYKITTPAISVFEIAGDFYTPKIYVYLHLSTENVDKCRSIDEQKPRNNAIIEAH